MFTIERINRQVFELSDTTEGRRSTLQFKGWSRNKADFSLPDGSRWSIRPKNWWGHCLLIYREGEVCGQIKLNWKGRLEIQLQTTAQRFVLKQRNFLSRQFSLYDEHQAEWLRIAQKMNWSRLHRDFEVEQATGLTPRAGWELLLLLSLFGIQFREAQMAAGG